MIMSCIVIQKEWLAGEATLVPNAIETQKDVIQKNVQNDFSLEIEETKNTLIEKELDVI